MLRCNYARCRSRTVVVGVEQRASGSRPYGSLAARDGEKTLTPLRFDVFVETLNTLNMHDIWVEKRAKSDHRLKRTGDFGAACEEAAKQRLLAQKHRPWQL